jgi:hypothetical protein
MPSIKRSATFAAAFAAAIAVFTTQEFIARRWDGGPRSWSSMLLAQSLHWACWAALTPLVIGPLCRRFTVRPGAMHNLGVHVITGFIVAAAQTLVVAIVLAYWYYGYSPLAMRDIFRDRIYTALAINVLVYGVIAAAIHAYSLARQSERRRVEAAESEARAARAELAALQARMQPHFLFNAFNGIAERARSTPATRRSPRSATSSRFSIATLTSRRCGSTVCTFTAKSHQTHSAPSFRHCCSSRSSRTRSASRSVCAARARSA